jgi:hypothetical protein
MIGSNYAIDPAELHRMFPSALPVATGRSSNRCADRKGASKRPDPPRKRRAGTGHRQQWTGPP